MRTIYKYPLKFWAEPQIVTMPMGAEIVHVELQHGDITLWALLGTSMPAVVRKFAIRGTGHPIDEGMKYVGTVSDPAGFVWHVLEVPVE